MPNRGTAVPNQTTLLGRERKATTKARRLKGSLAVGDRVRDWEKKTLTYLGGKRQSLTSTKPRKRVFSKQRQLVAERERCNADNLRNLSETRGHEKRRDSCSNEKLNPPIYVGGASFRDNSTNVSGTVGSIRTSDKELAHKDKSLMIGREMRENRRGGGLTFLKIPLHGV